MATLRLIRPQQGYEKELLSLISELHSADGGITPYGLNYDLADYQEIVKTCELYETEEGVRPGFVPSSTYWLVRTEDDSIVGAVNIRHRLNEHLSKIGGHIGYGVRPRERGKGYAHTLLKLALDKAQEIGIYNVVISCDTDNIPSRRTIERAGAVLDEELADDDGVMVRRYRIDNAPPNLYQDVGKLYDLDTRDNVLDDIPYYLSYLKGGDKVLELGCGTGRVSLEMARAGANVTGIDLSTDMLAALENKLEQEDNDVRARVIAHCLSIADFSIDDKFDLIIAPFRVFQALTSPNDANSCLKCVTKHLADEGKFIINVFRPNKNIETGLWCYEKAVSWERHDGKNDLTVTKSTSGDYIDTLEQLIYVTEYYEVRERGNFTQHINKLKLRYYFYEQLKNLLVGSGFRITHEYGWYDKSPVDGGRELIFVCKKK